jgi:hypothetical protein
MNTQVPTSEQLRERIAGLETAVSETGAAVAFADAALRNSFVVAVNSGDMTQTKEAQAFRNAAQNAHDDASALLAHAKDALAETILREATDARNAAITAMEPLEAEFLKAAKAADEAVQAVEAAFRRAVACDAALRNHVRVSRISVMWGGSGFRTGLQTHADRLRVVTERGLDPADHVHPDKATFYAEREVRALRAEIDRHTAESLMQ